MKAVIVDLDGTLADCGHREHHVTGSSRNWDAFFAGMGDDICVEPVAWLVGKLAAQDIRIILCSGRPDSHRDITIDWLARNGVPWDELNMRPAGDFRPDHLIKGLMLDAILADGNDVMFTIDDRSSVVRMWRDRGLVCLQARDWDEPKGGDPGLLTIMVGPSGSGKTTWLESDAALDLGIRRSQVLSSDATRADLCGDFRCQDKNDQVFRALHAQARERLAYGLPTVIDATNLKRKDRLACVACAPTNGPVRYVVIDRPLADKTRDGGWRLEIPGLLEKHDQTFRSQLKDILSGDGLVNVSVIDARAA